MKVTLGTTYYNNPENIVPFVEHHLEYLDELIIVDDGSADSYHILKYVQPSEKIKLYRVKHDYGFNSHGCRNLIMRESENEFVILIDSDRMIHNPFHSINIIKDMILERDRLYLFPAHFWKIGCGIHESVNDFIISKTHFFSVGGYDEEIIGYRGGDISFRNQLLNFGTEEILYEVNLIISRLPSTLLDDARLLSPNDIWFKELIRSEMIKIKNRIKNPEPDKKILTFEWEKL